MRPCKCNKYKGDKYGSDTIAFEVEVILQTSKEPHVDIAALVVALLIKEEKKK